MVMMRRDDDDDDDAVDVAAAVVVRSVMVVEPNAATGSTHQQHDRSSRNRNRTIKEDGRCRYIF
jgi:hypothetical protein